MQIFNGRRSDKFREIPLMRGCRHGQLWDYEIARRRRTACSEAKADWVRHSGLEESGARTAADAKRPKSIMSEEAEC
jgi:hypothetical protein